MSSEGHSTVRRVGHLRWDNPFTQKINYKKKKCVKSLESDHNQEEMEWSDT